MTSFFVTAQNSKLDSLKKLVIEANSDEALIRAKGDVALYHSHAQDNNKAITVAYEILELTKAYHELEDWHLPYAILAEGYLNMGKYDSATYYADVLSTMYLNGHPTIKQYFDHHVFKYILFCDMTDFEAAKSSLDSAEALIAGKSSLSYLQAQLNWNRGTYYARTGDFPKSIDHTLSSMLYFEEIKDLSRVAGLKQNVAAIYLFTGDTNNAVQLLEEASIINESMKNYQWLAHNTMTLAEIKIKRGNYIEGFKKSIDAFELYGKIKDGYNIGRSHYRIGDIFLTVYSDTIYHDLNILKVDESNIHNREFYLDSARIRFTKAYEIGEKYDITLIKGEAYNGLINLFLIVKAYEKAIYFAEKLDSLYQPIPSIILKIQSKNNMINAYGNKGMHEQDKRNFYEAAKCFFKTVEMQDELRILWDSTLSKNKINEINKASNKFSLEVQKKELEHKERERLEVEKNKRAELNIIIYSVAIGTLMIVMFLFLLYKRYTQTKKQNKLIRRQHKQLKESNQQLLASNKQVTDSINYASRIQTSLLPDQIENLFGEVFIYYKPKAVVSGDFYWSFQDENYKFLVVADCTGHGVSGAFMSVLGMSLLDKIVGQMRLLEPHKILTQLSLDISTKLQKDGDLMSPDGMDICLIRIEKKTNKLLYCGVGNDLIIRKPYETIRLKAEFVPIGLQKSGIDYADHEVLLLKGDRVFMYTDGFSDQFGGESGKKIGFAKFESLLVDNTDNSMKDICESLAKDFELHKGDYEQVDDLCIIGFVVG